jgi:hypothetical protein
MRTTVSAVVLAAALMAACRPAGDPAVDSNAPPEQVGPSSALAAPLCGGGAPAGFEPVVAGTETPLYTAYTRRAIKVKPGVEVRTGGGTDGRPPELTLIARDNSNHFRCGCPVGYSGSCALILSRDPGQEAVCDGECNTENSCCSGCALFKVP